MSAEREVGQEVVEQDDSEKVSSLGSVPDALVRHSVSQLFSLLVRRWFLRDANAKQESLAIPFSPLFIVLSQPGTGFPGALRNCGQRKQL